MLQLPSRMHVEGMKVQATMAMNSSTPTRQVGMPTGHHIKCSDTPQPPTHIHLMCTRPMSRPMVPILRILFVQGLFTENHLTIIMNHNHTMAMVILRVVLDILLEFFYIDLSMLFSSPIFSWYYSHNVDI